MTGRGALSWNPAVHVDLSSAECMSLSVIRCTRYKNWNIGGTCGQPSIKPAERELESFEPSRIQRL